VKQNLVKSEIPAGINNTEDLPAPEKWQRYPLVSEVLWEIGCQIACCLALALMARLILGAPGL
jgi:hypothetical protein